PLPPRAARYPDDAGPDDAVPPLPLDTQGMLIFLGKNPKLRDGQLDRSASLVKLCRVYERHGLAPHLAEVQLARDDGRLGWAKYSDRADAGRRYHDIVAEVYSDPTPEADGGRPQRGSARPLMGVLRVG